MSGSWKIFASLMCPLLCLSASESSVCWCLCLSSLMIFIFIYLFLFRRRTTVKMLCIYADYKSDESYTPSKISVRVGNNFHNLQEIRVTTGEQCLSSSKGRLKFMTEFHNHSNDLLFFFLTVLFFLTVAVGDGGAQWLDSHLSDEPGKKLMSLLNFIPF